MPRHRRAFALGLLAALAVAAPAVAVTQRGCDTFEANARNLVFPPELSTRSHANGAVRLLWLDTGGEPACCSSHLMVTLPSPEDPGDLCVLISGDPGWTHIDLAQARAAYDPATGLTLRMAVGAFDGNRTVAETLSVTIDQQSGTVTARQTPGTP